MYINVSFFSSYVDLWVLAAVPASNYHTFIIRAMGCNLAHGEAQLVNCLESKPAE